MENDARCAHMRVEYRTEDHRLTEDDVRGIPSPPLDSPYVPFRAGMTVTRGWWECASGCGMHFVPRPAASSHTPRGKDNGN